MGRARAVDLSNGRYSSWRFQSPSEWGARAPFGPQHGFHSEDQRFNPLLNGARARPLDESEVDLVKAKFRSPSEWGARAPSLRIVGRRRRHVENVSIPF